MLNKILAIYKEYKFSLFFIKFVDYKRISQSEYKKIQKDLDWLDVYYKKDLPIKLKILKTIFMAKVFEAMGEYDSSLKSLSEAKRYMFNNRDVLNVNSVDFISGFCELLEFKNNVAKWAEKAQSNFSQKICNYKNNYEKHIDVLKDSQKILNINENHINQIEDFFKQALLIKDFKLSDELIDEGESLLNKLNFLDDKLKNTFKVKDLSIYASLEFEKARIYFYLGRKTYNILESLNLFCSQMLGRQIYDPINIAKNNFLGINFGEGFFEKKQNDFYNYVNEFNINLYSFKNKISHFKLIKKTDKLDNAPKIIYVQSEQELLKMLKGK